MMTSGVFCPLLVVSLTVVASEFTVNISQRANDTTVHSLCPSCDDVSKYAFGILNKASALIYADVQFYNCYICNNYPN